MLPLRASLTLVALIAHLPAGAPTASPESPAASAPAAPALVPAALADPVPLAVGVLMHRYSLSRADALKRLQRLADDQQLSRAAQAERLLSAVEELARSA